MFLKKIIFLLVAIYITPISISANIELLKSRCEEAKTWKIRNESDLEKALELAAEINLHEHNPLRAGEYRDTIPPCYEALLVKVGNYYFNKKYYGVALRYYKEAQEYSMPDYTYSPKYRDNIKICKKEEKNKKKIPAVECKKIVFVVDISTDIKGRLAYTKKFLSAAYRKFWDIGKNEFHLIIFSDRAKPYPPEEIDSISKIENIIDTAIGDTKEFNHNKTFPKHGLSGVFDLVAEKFPQKVGVIIFISSGKDSRGNTHEVQTDLGKTIRALKKNGFTVYSIFLSKRINNSAQEELMKKIAEYAETTPLQVIGNDTDIDIVVKSLKERVKKTGFCSPVPRDKYEEEKNAHITTLKKTEEAKTEANKNTANLEWNIIMEKLTSFQLEIENRRLNEKIIEKDIKIKGKDSTIRLLLFSGLALFVIILSGRVIYIFCKRQIPKNTICKLIIEKIKPKTPLGILWGIVAYKIKNKEQPPIKLGEESPGFSLQPLENSPGIQFYSGYHDGKKVIQLHGSEDIIISTFDNDSRRYLDEKARYFEIPNGGNNPKYEYHFLDILYKSSKDPMWRDGAFVGRSPEIGKVRDGFKETMDLHFLIHGMGKVGKTSLMKRIEEVLFGEKGELSEKYASIYIQYDRDEHPDFSIFKEKLSLLLEDAPKRAQTVILIDEYDEALISFKKKFLNLLERYFKTDDYYLILAGQRNCDLLEPKYCETIKRKVEQIPLKGLDGIQGHQKKHNQKKSIDLIDQQLLEIGFPVNYISRTVKQEIARVSSGFPSLIKHILYYLLNNWIKDEKMHPIRLNHVDDAVSETIPIVREYLIDKVRNEDELNRVIPDTEIRISRILNAISINSDRMGEVEMKRLTDRLIPEEDGTLRTQKKESLINKVKMLENKGFVVDKGDYLIGVPNIFFYKGDTLYDEP